MRWSRGLGACLAVALGVVVGVAPAVANTPAGVDSVTVQGDAVVGATLTAVVVAVGDPAPAIGYQWARCDAAQPSRCSTITGATAPTYTVADLDLGHTLVVKVTAKNTGGTDSAKSDRTTVVVAPPPPTPDPTPTPTPDPTVPVTSDPGVPVAVGSVSPADSTIVPIDAVAAPIQAPSLTATAPAHASYLRPFPVIRVAGSGIRGGAYIKVLRVTAPAGTRVAISCLGRGCPVRRLARGPGRIRQLERFLPAGVDVTIRATRGGYIGKYVRFVVRSHAAPTRRDACLMPGRARPVRCP
jgi:hypothetical protein